MRSPALKACFLPLLLLGAATTALTAQAASDVRIGARVRIERLEGDKEKTLTGTFVSQTADSVQLRLDRSNELVSIPRTETRRFEVSREQRSGAGRGALTGLAAGGVFGFLVGISCDCGEPALAAVILGGMFGGLGTGLGAAVGSAGRIDRWEQVPF